MIVAGARAIDYLQGIDLPDHHIERPKMTAHGDYASNIGLVVATLVRRPPQEIARDIAARLDLDPLRIEKVEVVPPGFINFYVTTQWLQKSLNEIIQADVDYGRSASGERRHVQVEFVSANPTGPLNVVSARAAAVGDALANILQSTGHDVSREYYVNDAGRQMDLLALSVEAAYLRLLGYAADGPEGGYKGGYIEDMAATIRDREGDALSTLALEDRRDRFRQMVLNEILEHQKETLGQFRLVYDTWFSESTLRQSGALDQVVRKLSEANAVYQQDGATWFASTRFGDEKDRVLITSEGQPTYFLADIAYHVNKFERGFEWVIDLWGPDHHGHIARMKAAMKALGYDPRALELKIVQQVNLLQGGEKAKMSKREGRLVTMRELIAEVGVDAARFFFLMRKTSAHLDFDLDLATSQSEENPVYYVQYAHARICSILRHAGAAQADAVVTPAGDVSLLTSAEEISLIRHLVMYPEAVESSARNLEPHGLTTYLQDVAGAFHPFYHQHRVVTGAAALTAARLTLVQAVRIVLRNGLSLLGISAPEQM